MTIYVIRHGQTDYNILNLYQGHIDIPLNQMGIKQAKEVAKKFKDIKIDYILMSPLVRARETAKYINEMIGGVSIIEEGIIERSFGDMEGHPNQEYCNINMLLDYDKNYNIYHVEPIQTFFKRVFDCIDKIIEKYRNKNIVLVTHAGVAQAIECYFNGSTKDINKYTLKNGEIREYYL